MVYIGGDEGSVTEIKFEKCKDGVTLYRDLSLRGKSFDMEEQLSPLSPKTKRKEMSALTEVISNMASMRMDDQRCSLFKVIKRLTCYIFILSYQGHNSTYE